MTNRAVPSTDACRDRLPAPMPDMRFDSCGRRSMEIVRDSFVSHETSARLAIWGCLPAPSEPEDDDDDGAGRFRSNVPRLGGALVEDAAAQSASLPSPSSSSTSSTSSSSGCSFSPSPSASAGGAGSGPISA